MSDTWDIPMLDPVREMFYNMMAACATIVKQQKVVTGFEHSLLGSTTPGCGIATTVLSVS